MDEVDEVVVDNMLMHSGVPGSVTHSEHLSSPEAPSHGQQTDQSETFTAGTGTGTRSEGLFERFPLLTWLRWRAWPALVGVFTLRFFEPKMEEHYRKEVWYTSKSLAIYTALFFVINWILGVIVVPRPLVTPDRFFYWCMAPLSTLPLPFFIIYDFPQNRPIFYQCYLAWSTWIWGLYQILFLFVVSLVYGLIILTISLGICVASIRRVKRCSRVTTKTSSVHSSTPPH